MLSAVGRSSTACPEILKKADVQVRIMIVISSNVMRLFSSKSNRAKMAAEAFGGTEDEVDNYNAAAVKLYHDH